MPLVVFTDTMEINQDNIIIINKKKKNKSHIKSRTHLFKKQQKKKQNYIKSRKMELIQTQKIKILTYIDTPNFNNPNHQPRRLIQTNPKRTET